VRKLTTDDIVDHRAYEREREAFRAQIIDMKRRRRIALGDVVTIVFENTDTMRWQVQEMARVERMLRDEQIAHEVATYNELIPDENELSATLLIELHSDEQLREWLPKLVGIQRSIVVQVADLEPVRGVAQDEERLTREDVTAAVHFMKFRFTPEHVKAFGNGPVTVISEHPKYQEETTLSDVQRLELAEDFSA
jgi:D-mannonate dehydratase